jgi:hypothetical protein
MSTYRDLDSFNQAIGNVGRTITQNQMLDFQQKQALQNQLMQNKQFEAGNERFGAEMKYKYDMLNAMKDAQRQKAGNFTPQEIMFAQGLHQTVKDLADFKYKGDFQAALRDYVNGPQKAKINPRVLAAHEMFYGGAMQPEPVVPEGPGMDFSRKHLKEVSAPVLNFLGVSSGPPAEEEIPLDVPGMEQQAVELPPIVPVVSPSTKAGAKMLAPNTAAGNRRLQRKVGQ